MSKAKQWTFMVWLAGDNDLEDYALADLREMKKVGSTDAVDVVAQVDRQQDSHTRRYHLRKGTSLEQDQVEEFGETDTGDPAVAAAFFSWAMGRFPAKHFVAVLWNHGSGIDETDVYARVRGMHIEVARRLPETRTTVPRSRIRTIASRAYRRALFATTVKRAISDRGIAYDDSAKDFLDNMELKKVLATVKQRTKRGVDVLGFDACLMSMVEIAYELAPYASVLVGSQEVEPGDGWPYDTVLQALAARPSMTAEALGETIVSRYGKSYPRTAVTLAALRESRVHATAEAIDAFARALIAAVKQPAEYGAVAKAVRAAQHYDTKDFIDLCDFAGEVRKRTRNARVKVAAADVVKSICDGDSSLVGAEFHRSERLAGSHGVSVYFPRGDATVAYDRLAFAKDTRWPAFLDTL